MEYFTTNNIHITIILTLIFSSITTLTLSIFNVKITDVDLWLVVFVSFIISNQIRIYVTKEKK